MGHKSLRAVTDIMGAIVLQNVVGQFSVKSG